MTDLLSTDQVAKELGVSTSYTYRLLKDVPYVKSGRTKLYSLEDVQKSELGSQELSYEEIGGVTTNRWNFESTEKSFQALKGRQGRDLLREMRINDPIIAAVFMAVENSIRQVTWRVKPASESVEDLDAANFVRQCMDDMSYSFNDELQYILNFLEQGFAVMEVVYKKRLGDKPPAYVEDAAPSQYDDGKIGWRKWAPRPANSLVDGNEWNYDNNGGIKGINQIANNVTVEIPIEKLLLFRTTMLPADSPEGVPIHRSAYIPWWMSNNIQEVEGIGIERDLAGIPVIYMGADTKKRGTNSDFEQAKSIVTNLRADDQAGVVFPYPKLGLGGENRGMLLELLSSTGRRQYDTSKIIERYDKRKAISMLAQFIMLGMDAVGSFALGRIQADIFALAVSAWATNIAEVLNRYAIPKLIKYNNFQNLTGYPKIVPSDIGLPNLEEVATYVNTMVNASIIKPDKELERHLRQIAHLPEVDESAVDEPATAAPNDKAVLRATRASLLLNRLRLLLRDATLTPEQALPLIEEAKQELMNALNADEIAAGTAAPETIAQVDAMASDPTDPNKKVK